MGRAFAVSVATMRFGWLHTLRIGGIANVTSFVASASGTRLPRRWLVHDVRSSDLVSSGVGHRPAIVARSLRVRAGPSVAERDRFAAGEKQRTEYTSAFHFELAVCVISDRTRLASGLFGWRARKRSAAAFPAVRLPLFSKASMRSASASGPSVRCLN
jgi:hypothetical protein